MLSVCEEALDPDIEEAEAAPEAENSEGPAEVEEVDEFEDPEDKEFLEEVMAGAPTDADRLIWPDPGRP